MKKTILFLILFSVFGNSQSLIYLKNMNDTVGEPANIYWSYSWDNNYLIATSDKDYISRIKGELTIVEADVENYKYYIIQSDNFSFLPEESSIQIIFRINDFYILKSKQNIGKPDQLKHNIFKRIDVYNNAFIFNEENNFVPEITAIHNQDVFDIIADVNIDSIYNNQEYLTGEKPVLINGQPEIINTRYTYSNGVFKAQDFIKNQLEKYNYQVEIQPFSELSTFYDVQFCKSNNDSGWIAATDKIYFTADGGQSWEIQYDGDTGSIIWSLYVLDAQHVYAVGDYGLILTSENGGGTWQIRNTPVNAFLFGVYFANIDTGWVCGDTGYILKTVNGGQNWLTKSSLTSQRLYDIAFLNGAEGIAVGRNGTILKTTNSGGSWDLKVSGTSERLYGVHFINELSGYAVGWNSTILKTEDAGKNWTNTNYSNTADLYDVDFSDTLKGIIVGWNGTSLRTTDGGQNWTSLDNLFNEDLYAVDMLDSQKTWASGNGIVAKSDNFGINWNNIAADLPESTINNIIASKTGTVYPNQYFVLCAHYDDISENPLVYAPGADDNGSGTATVLEAARIMSQYNFEYTVKLILFAGEEQGLYGSAYYAAQAYLNNHHIPGVINLDMIGYDSDNDGIFEIHTGNMSNSQAIGMYLRDNISIFNVPLVPEYITSGATGASDHASFWDYGYPAILQIEDFDDFTPWYHSTGDLLSTLNPDYFESNAKLAIGTLASLAAIDTLTNIDYKVPDDFNLFLIYPNPFNSTINIEYYLPVTAHLSCTIYDVNGKIVSNLIKNKFSKPGSYKVKWSGRDDSGVQVSSGLYIIRIYYSGSFKTAKIIYLR